MYINGKYYHHIRKTDCISIHVITRYIVFTTDTGVHNDQRFYRNRRAFPHHLRLFPSTKYSIRRPKEEDGLRLHNAVIHRVCGRRCENAMSIGKTILFRKSTPRKNMTRFCTHATRQRAMSFFSIMRRQTSCYSNKFLLLNLLLNVKF